mmetsp:Transcript_3005/g.7326  ORF Transcript_3005/g.7326 Transcript_3005/m.7326 type:complete len:408 (-) Transcript_3005:962-2185(-)
MPGGRNQGCHGQGPHVQSHHGPRQLAHQRAGRVLLPALVQEVLARLRVGARALAVQVHVRRVEEGLPPAHIVHLRLGRILVQLQGIGVVGRHTPQAVVVVVPQAQARFRHVLLQRHAQRHQSCAVVADLLQHMRCVELPQREARHCRLHVSQRRLAHAAVAVHLQRVRQDAPRHRLRCLLHGGRRLRAVKLHAMPVHEADGLGAHGRHMGEGCCSVEPMVRLLQVGRDAVAVVLHDAEVEHSVGGAQVGGALKVLGSLGEVHGRAKALVVHDGQAGEARGHRVVGRDAEVGGRVGEVAECGGGQLHDAHIGVPQRVPHLRCVLELRKGLRVVPRDAIQAVVVALAHAQGSQRAGVARDIVVEADLLIPQAVVPLVQQVHCGPLAQMCVVALVGNFDVLPESEHTAVA